VTAERTSRFSIASIRNGTPSGRSTNGGSRSALPVRVRRQGDLLDSGTVKNVEAGYAIIRLDLDPAPTDEDRYTVKRVVWSEDEAAAEVARLNEVNAGKNCRYFWQYTRVDQRA
jgi:hypothetical protein